MDPSNYHAIARLQQENWWYAARRMLIDQILDQYGPYEVGLDLGCGLGANLALLARRCSRWQGIDPSLEAVNWCREQGYEFVHQGDATHLDAQEHQFDLVTCLDVLEHLDDRAAVGEILRVLKPGGLLVVTVPAHQHLWNENDDFSQHQRRYSRSRLASLLADFQSLDISFWNFTAYLPMLMYAALRRVVPSRPRNNLDAVPGLANGTLLWALRLENRLRRFLPTPTGTSLVAIGRAPSKGSR